MFSGIISAIGKVQAVQQRGSTNQIIVTSPFSSELHPDQSISHDGICLTVVSTLDDTHTVDVVKETLLKTTFAEIHIGQFINLEKAITPTTMLDGHIVQGHVDTTLQCLEVKDLQGSWIFKFNLSKEYAGLVVLHGSICLNGVSLTIANLFVDSFEVAVIPYTYHHTNFQYLNPGDRVNVEFDLVGKYLLRQMEAYRQ